MNLRKKIKIILTRKKRRAKRNTWYRNFRAWELRFDRRQQQRNLIPETVDATERKCANCGHVYEGRVCPQCGQVGTWKRYTWLQAIINFLDIWGLGNRPMFRTLKDLFWRPGYMIRDYLEGRRQFYFPPFKLLAVAVALMVFTSWLTGVKKKTLFQRIFTNEDIKETVSSLTGPLATIANTFMDFVEFLAKNPLYEWLFVSVFVVICVWFGFRRHSRCNFVETYIFLVFVLAQQLICLLPEALGTTLFTYVKDHTVLHLGRSTAVSIRPIHGFLDMVGGRVSYLYVLFVNLLIIIDFRQFYGLKWKTTLMRLLYSGFIGIVILIIFNIYFLNNLSRDHAILVTTYLILAPLSFYVVGKYLRKHQEQINRSVIWACKALAFTLLVLFVTSSVASVRIDGYSLISQVLALVGSVLLTALVSLLPAVLYMKFHKTWLSWLSVPVLLSLLVALTTIEI